MLDICLAVPGDPLTPTGGYIYDRRLADGLRDRGARVRWLRLPDAFPFPAAEDRRAAGEALAALPPGTLTVIDGLALGAMPDEARAESTRLRLVALVHHPLADESGLGQDQARRLHESERDALAAVRHVIVTSATTAARLRDAYAVPAARITVAEPGTDRPAPGPGPRARGGNGNEAAAPSLLCVATLTPRKGHDLLFAALGRLRDQRWSLTCVGAADRDPVHATLLRAQIHDLALSDRIHLHVDATEDELRRHYARADLFVLPTRLEGYGMALAEAVANGLPVVTTAGGAAERTVGPGVGVFVPLDDVDALEAALRRLLDDAGHRQALAAGARARAEALPRWPDTARIVADTLASLDR